MASHGVPRVTGNEPLSEQSRQKQLPKIKQYIELVELVTTKIAAQEYTPEVLALTSQLLTRNPEYYTIWNNRRLILQDLFRTAAEPSESSQHGAEDSTVLDLITADLQFLIPLLRQFPKCYWIWNHRLWLLQQSTHLLAPTTARRLWQQELGLVGKMLSLDSRNFHGWGYRRTVVAALEDPQLDPASSAASDELRKPAAGTRMVEAEFAYTTKMIETNLSNFSAWHNRSKLMPRLLDARGATDAQRTAFVDEEFDLIWQALWTDPFDQSLWFYYQFLMTLTSSSPSTSSASSSAAAAAATAVQRVSVHDELLYLERELARLKELLEDTTDCKWVYQGLLANVARYLQIEAGNKHVSTREMRAWLAQLKALDPLRRGRWEDLGEALGIGDG